jgi:hypothetical protein
MLQHVRSVLSDGQAHRATGLLRHNLARSTDWIVLNVTMDVLAQWARCDPELSEWLAGLVAAVAADEPRVRGRADGGEDDHDEEDIKAS